LSQQQNHRIVEDYRAPEVRPEEVTPALVRDELLLCFESANKQFAELLKMPVTDEAVREQVKQFVTSVFGKCGASFDNPTKEGIKSAISECKRNAESMMGPQGASIINHHYAEMMKLVNQLP